MTPDELRALAEALSRQRQADEHGIYCAVPRQAVDAAIKYLRAQADAQPVAWRTFDGEGNYDYRAYELNEDYADEWNRRNPNHVGWVEPLYTHPAPAAPQAEPKRDQSMLDLLAVIHCDGGHHTEAVGIEQSIKDALSAVCVLKGKLAQAEPKREPLSDERIDVALQADPAMILALMSGEMTVGEFKAALRRVARTVERAHGIGGSDAE